MIPSDCFAIPRNFPYSNDRPDQRLQVVELPQSAEAAGGNGGGIRNTGSVVFPDEKERAARHHRVAVVAAPEHQLDLRPPAVQSESSRQNGGAQWNLDWTPLRAGVPSRKWQHGRTAGELSEDSTVGKSWGKRYSTYGNRHHERQAEKPAEDSAAGKRYPAFVLWCDGESFE